MNLRLVYGLSKSLIFDGDATFAIQCPDWPDQVCNWKARPNRRWPSQEAVLRITSPGCHIVPKSHKDDHQGVTWRISFSRAEVDLSVLIPKMARFYFIGLKVIAKDYLSITCKRIKSYHLKCILFNTLETTDPEFWKDEDNLEAGFSMLLNNLKKKIQNTSCPHYWIPHINLFQEINQKDVTNLLEVIENVEKKPETYIEVLKVENENDDIIFDGRMV